MRSKKYNRLVTITKKEVNSDIENKLVITSVGRGEKGQDWGRGLKNTSYYV